MSSIKWIKSNEEHSSEFLSEPFDDVINNPLEKDILYNNHGIAKPGRRHINKQNEEDIFHCSLLYDNKTNLRNHNRLFHEDSPLSTCNQADVPMSSSLFQHQSNSSYSSSYQNNPNSPLLAEYDSNDVFNIPSEAPSRPPFEPTLPSAPAYIPSYSNDYNLPLYRNPGTSYNTFSDSQVPLDQNYRVNRYTSSPSSQHFPLYSYGPQFTPENSYLYPRSYYKPTKSNCKPNRHPSTTYPDHSHSHTIIYKNDHYSPISHSPTRHNHNKDSSSYLNELNYNFINKRPNVETNDNRPKELPPGELNPNATLGGKLCFEFMNTGRCHRMEEGSICRYRHLVPNHPDAIADRYKSGLLSPDIIEELGLRPCGADETNPFAPIDAPICYEFLNRGVCTRTSNMNICRYRHLLPSHPEAIADRIRSFGKAG